ncbi:hypothetical protein INR49_003563 [Caranx melampygus]|nr:hypothetical protein INR49_003563 [Caranx melampygus]
MKLHRALLAGCIDCTRMYLPGNFYPKRLFCSAFPQDLARLEPSSCVGLVQSSACEVHWATWKYKTDFAQQELQCC